MGLGTQTYDRDFKQNLFLGEGGMTESLNKIFGQKILPEEDLQLESISPGQWIKGRGLAMRR
jgi:hypothetical protein